MVITQYRIRLYPPFGYSILYEEYNLTWFNHQKKDYSLELPLGDGTFGGLKLWQGADERDRFKSIDQRIGKESQMGFRV